MRDRHLVQDQQFLRLGHQDLKTELMVNLGFVFPPSPEFLAYPSHDQVVVHSHLERCILDHHR